MTEEKSVQQDPSEAGTAPKLANSPLIHYGISIALLGLCIGLFAGLSQSPVVGVLLPLLFGLIGGANGVYLARTNLENKQERKQLGLIGRMLSILLIFVLIGTVYGISIRTGSELSAFLPSLRPTEPHEDVVVLDNLDAMGPSNGLELSLLRYRLRALGVQESEQRAILSVAQNSLEESFDIDKQAVEFRHLFSLQVQLANLLTEQNDYPSEVVGILEFLESRQYQYEYIADMLLLSNIPVEHLTALLDEDRNAYSNLIRENSFDENSFSAWLLEHSDIRDKIWGLELAYFDAINKFRNFGDLGWLSRQPLAEVVDKLILTSGGQAISDSESDFASEVQQLRFPAIAP